VILRRRLHPVAPPALRAACVALAACAVFVSFSGTASAAIPCWKRLMNDWYTPPINNIYPIQCYHQALEHLPTDVSVYSSARDDITRALQQAIAYDKAHDKAKTSTNVVPNPAATTTPTTTSGTTSTNSLPSNIGGTTTTSKPKSPVSRAIRDITPGGADSFPLPLLILGLLAILLILAGIAGMFWRRYQGRRGTA